MADGRGGAAPTVNVTIMTRDAESFRQSRTQVAADIARAVSMGLGRSLRHVMAFHEVRFPDAISRGARGGPERRTQIVELASGDEERNASWANSRRRYDVAYGIRRADDLAAVVAFFEARNGRLHGFRFKDWGDHKSCLPSGTPSPIDQPLGTGDGTTTRSSWSSATPPARSPGRARSPSPSRAPSASRWAAPSRPPAGRSTPPPASSPSAAAPGAGVPSPRASSSTCPSASTPTRST
jgi:hypothetical protein